MWQVTSDETRECDELKVSGLGSKRNPASFYLRVTIISHLRLYFRFLILQFAVRLKPKSGAALFPAISPHQPHSGKTHSRCGLNDLAKINHPSP